MVDENSFEIQGRLVGMNELINSARTNRFGSAAQKKSQMQLVTNGIQQSPIQYKHFTEKVSIYITFLEKNSRRDVDNVIGGGCKSIFDSLVNNGILIDDSQKYVCRVVCEVGVDKENPRICVTIKEE